MTAFTAANHLDQNLASFEKALNVLGYIPIVSSVTGFVRVQYGKFEVVASIAVAAFKFIASLFARSDAQRAQLEMESVQALTYIKHGLANFARGMVEMIPFVNLIMIAHDRIYDRLRYPTEVIG